MEELASAETANYFDYFPDSAPPAVLADFIINPHKGQIRIHINPDDMEQHAGRHRSTPEPDHPTPTCTATAALLADCVRSQRHRSCHEVGERDGQTARQRHVAESAP